jgi:hypothetical protein
MSRDIVAGPAVAFMNGRAGIFSLVVTAVDFLGAGRYGSGTTACWPLNTGRTARVLVLAGARSTAGEGRTIIQSKMQSELQDFLPANAVAPFVPLIADRGRWS